MEVFTSACFILMLYCTEWLGIRQCYTLPVPTLINYYHNSPNQNWNWKYRQHRNPELYHDKFVFPNKQAPSEDIAERSGSNGPFQKDAGKIFFPDEVPSSLEKNKKPAYQFSDTDVNPVWRIRHRDRPSPEPMRIPSSSPLLDVLKGVSKSVDVSSRDKENSVKTQVSNTDHIHRSPFSPSQITKPTEKEHVASAVQDWYEWYKERKRLGDLKKKVNDPSAPTNANKMDSVVSDQSLVAGLKNQKCPDGQIRLENGECRVQIEI